MRVHCDRADVNLYLKTSLIMYISSPRQNSGAWFKFIFSVIALVQIRQFAMSQHAPQRYILGLTWIRPEALFGLRKIYKKYDTIKKRSP